MTKTYAPWCFICSLNFMSHNFQTESHLKCVTPTYRGSTTLSFLSSSYAQHLGHFEFKTLLMSSSAFSERPNFFLYQTIQLVIRVESAQASFFSGTKKFLHSVKLQATTQMAGFLWVLPKSFFKKLLLGTGLWQHAKMSTSLKSPNRLKMPSARKGSWATGRPFRTYLWLTLSHPRKNLKFSRSSFWTSLTSVCPSTHVGTTRNKLHILFQSSVS